MEAKGKVLVVDDEPELVRIITINLEMDGYQVIPAYHGKEALEKARSEHPDCILLDIMMPVMDGWEVMHHLKEDPLTADIPVIVITARSTDVDKLKGYSGGAIEYITKPFDPVELSSTVSRILQPQEREERIRQRADLIRRLQLATIYDITRALISTLELQEVLDIIVEKLLILLNLTICGISLLDGEENMLRFSAAKSIEPLKEQDINLFQYPLDRLGGEFAGRLTQEMEYLKFDGPSFVVSPVTPLLKSLKSIYLFPLVARDNFTGVLTLAKNAPMFFSQDEVELLHAICNGAAIAIENARLYENLRRDEEIHKELLHRVVTVQEDERRRLAVELHDGIIQNLVSALYRQQFCLARLQEAPREVISAMEEVRQIIDATIMEMRRVIEGLRPAMLDDLGLYKAIEVYTKSLETKYPIRIELELEEPQLSLKPEAENAIFRILQEGLNNMVKHSHCERGRVCLRNDNGVLELQMSDDGLGFDVESIRTKAPQSYGLLGMQERVDYLGGELRISSRPGEGTLITVRVPLEKIVREN